MPNGYFRAWDWDQGRLCEIAGYATEWFGPMGGWVMGQESTIVKFPEGFSGPQFGLAFGLSAFLLILLLPLSQTAYAQFPDTATFRLHQQCAARNLSSSPSYLKVVVHSVKTNESFESVVTATTLASALATEFSLWSKAREENPSGTVVSDRVADLFRELRTLKIFKANPDFRFQFSSQAALATLWPTYSEAHVREMRKALAGMDKDGLRMGFSDNGGLHQLYEGRRDLEYEARRAAIAHVLLEKGLHPSIQDLTSRLSLSSDVCDMRANEEALGFAIVELARLGHDLSVVTATSPSPPR